MAYFWFFVIVCVVVATGGKVIEFSYHSLIDTKSYTLIAPFEVAGGDGTGNEGLVLAGELQAKLYWITREQEAVVSALTSPAVQQPAPSASAIAFKDEIAPQTGETAMPPMYLKVFRVTDLEARIAEIEVGGLFNWAYRTLAERSALKFSVTKTELGDQAVVTGQLLRDGSSAMYATVGSSNERIVAAVAYSLYREQLAATIPQMRGLEWDDLERIHIATTDLAALKGTKISPYRSLEDYKKKSDEFQETIKKAPRWRELLLIGAELARQARELDLSEHYLRRALELTDAEQESDKYKSIEDSIKHLKESAGIEFADDLNSFKSDPAEVYTKALTTHRSILEIEDGDRQRQPVVAIFGDVPFRDRVGYDFTISPNTYVADRDIEAFIDTLALIVKSISPNTKLIFATRPKPLSATPKSSNERESINHDIATSLEILDRNYDPEILIFPFTKSIGDSAVDAVLAKLNQSGCLIIAPVSTNGVPMGAGPLTATMALVSATDIAGRPAYFSWRADGLLWAPGTQVPALTPTGEWTIGQSSAYAAAAAAGVAANVLSSADRMSPRDLLDLLRNSSRQIDPRDDGVRVLSQRAALAKVSPPAAKPADPTPPAAESDQPAEGGATASQ